MDQRTEHGARGRVGKATRASNVAERLFAAILSGELAPGAKLNLDRLRADFGVSLSPMREAVGRLLPSGLVAAEDQRGYRIAPVSCDNLAEITRLRADLDCLALGHACAGAGLDWESEVLAALHRLRRTARDPARPDALAGREAAHTAFHAALTGGAGLPMLIGFCRTLAAQAERYRRLFPAPEVSDAEADAEHATIAMAAVARDGARATALLRAHIEQGGARLAARMTEPGA